MNVQRPVLIVEDTDDVRDVLEILVRLEGFEVRTARDGQEALVEMRREPAPCVVLLDLHMPVMDGYEFRAQQRLDATLMQVPVILYSGDHDVARAAATMGVEGYFQKPFDTAAIVALINRYGRCEAEG
jgi:CheY-like chemotaxis protein